MATSKRKQDEKHLKILRDLGTLFNNKQCFDCHQRGPTYINMTVGSFVCTSCSGILRGLNPPHRVKSISMTSFTADEIDFIKSRGNEFCKRVWLGTYDSRSMVEPESKDEQRIKDFMVQKYERKRWYVDPSIALKNQPLTSSASSQQMALPDTKPLSSVLGNNVKQITLHNNQSSVVNRPTISTATSLGNINSHTRSAFDLLSDLGDPFSSTNASGAAAANNANANFANFDNFQSGTGNAQQNSSTNSQQYSLSNNVSNNASQQAAAFNNTANSNNTNTNSIQTPSVDKYAALADLDSLFHNNVSVTPPASQPVDWEGKGTTGWSLNGTTTLSFFTANPSCSNLTAIGAGNPFTGGYSSSFQSANNYGQYGGVINKSPETFNAVPVASSNVSGGFLESGQFGVQNGSSLAWHQSASSQQANSFQGNNKIAPVASSQFGGWVQPMSGNPFSTGNQIPPRANSSNPFL